MPDDVTDKTDDHLQLIFYPLIPSYEQNDPCQLRRCHQEADKDPACSTHGYKEVKNHCTLADDSGSAAISLEGEPLKATSKLLLRTKEQPQTCPWMLRISSLLARPYQHPFTLSPNSLTHP